MENNIDKIFRNALENHQEMPPSDAWKHVRTEILKKEKSMNNSILISLLLGLLLISGITTTIMMVDTIPETISITTKKPVLMVSKNVNNNIPRGRLSIKNKPLSLFLKPSKKFVNQHYPLSLKKSNAEQNIYLTNNYQNEIQSTISEIKEPLMFTPNLEVKKEAEKLEMIDSGLKNYVYTDVSKKMREDLMTKISKEILADELIEKDSTEKESKGKFSLRHPIFSFTTGVIWNNWSIRNDNYIMLSPTFNSDSKSTFIRLGIAWKLNKRTRLGFNVGQYNSGGFQLGWKSPLTSSSINSPQLIFKPDNSNPTYTAETPFGNIQIPIQTLINSEFIKDAKNPPQNIAINNGSDLHSFSYVQGEICIENDLYSRKRTNNHLFQIFSITNLTFQRPQKYQYWATEFRAYPPSIPFTIPNKVNVVQNNLDNGASIIWGLKYGFGIRWQFAKTLNFNVEAVMQSNLNSWVKNPYYRTYQNSSSIQFGIQFNP